MFYGRYLKKLSNKTQEALGDLTKVAQEALSALRTVQAFNAAKQEEGKFHEKVTHVLSLGRKEAIASGIFFGATGWSGNVTLLALLGYGQLFVLRLCYCLQPVVISGYRRHAREQRIDFNG